MSDELTRLPCRGCLRSCKYYAHCNGRLWRMVNAGLVDRFTPKPTDKKPINKKGHT